MRNSLRLYALAGVFALLLTACGRPEVTVQNVPSGTDEAAPGGISVTGTGEVKGVPDTLTLSFGVSVLRPNVSQAVADAAETADGLIATLKGHGIAAEDIQTVNYSIYPEYDWSRERQELKGYRVDNTVSAKIRDVARAGEIIDAAAAAAGDEVRISGVQFSLDDNEALLEAARAEAWADARAKAEQLATLAGVELGGPISIVENVSSEGPSPYFRAEAIGADVATPIEPGQQAVTVTLSVRFAISS